MRTGLFRPSADLTAAHEQHGTTGMVKNEARGVADGMGAGTRVGAAAGEQHDEPGADRSGDGTDLPSRFPHADLRRLEQQAAFV